MMPLRFVMAVAFSLLAVPAFAATTVNVSLSDDNLDSALAGGLGMNMGADASKAIMRITADQPTVPAGEVTFAVKNDAKGFVHEMILAPVPADGAPLPFDAKSDRVNEDQAGSLGEVSELKPGETGSLTVSLTPGQYILYCNVAGHYMAGMWTTITVQ